MSDRRPFLNMRSRVSLLTPLDLSDDLVKQFGAEYREDDTVLDEIIFSTDRLSADRLISANESLEFHGFDLFSTDLFIFSNVVSKGQVTEFTTKVRGTMFKGTMSLQIPADRAYTTSEVRDAFPDANVERSGFSYLLTPKDEPFMLSDDDNNFHLEGLDELGVKPSNAIYASGVEGKITGETGFF